MAEALEEPLRTARTELGAAHARLASATGGSPSPPTAITGGAESSGCAKLASLRTLLGQAAM